MSPLALLSDALAGTSAGALIRRRVDGSGSGPAGADRISPRQAVYLDTLHWLQMVQHLDRQPSSASEEADLVTRLGQWSDELERELDASGSKRSAELYRQIRSSFSDDRRIPRDLVIEISGVLADDVDHDAR